MNLTRENINSKVNEIDSTIANLQTELKNINYKTMDHNFDCFGHVDGMELEEVVEAMTKLKENKNDTDAACVELGITAEELGNKNANWKYKGFTYEEWVTDFKNRVLELRIIGKIDKLNKARKILFRNLSEDDIFNREMGAAGDLLNGLLD